MRNLEGVLELTKKIFTPWKICIAVLVLILLLSVILSSVYVYATKNVFKGVSCAGVSLEGMDALQVEEAIRNAVARDYQQKDIRLSLDGQKKNIKAEEFEVKYDFEKTASEVVRYGREGNFFERVSKALGALFSGYDQEICISYNKEKLSDCVERAIDGIGTPVKEYSYEIEGDNFYIINGEPGDMANSDDVCNEILRAIKHYRFDEELVFEKETRNPKDVDIDALHTELSGMAQDAYYVCAAGEVTIEPHRYHVDFNKDEAKKIASQNKEYGKKYSIPAMITAPKMTQKQAEERLFTQVLGKYKTTFNQGDVSRSSNIELAAKLINGTVLMPGEEFSYNTIVGKRTQEAGFKVAHVYMNNEVADGIGGGICQVSSTLYCAVLYANLEVLERVNHQLTVSYVPAGQDATVDWGNIDFKFKNSTEYPIRINTHAEGGTMYSSIEGYREIREDVELIPVRVASVPPTVVEEKDPTLPLGERKEEKVGSAGTVAELYKVVTINGVASPRTFVSKSTYASGKTIVKVGTGEAVEKEEEASGEEITGEETTGETVGEETAEPETPAEEVPAPAEVPEESETESEL